MTGDLWKLSLDEVSTLIRTKALSPVELLESTLTHVERMQPSIDAFASVTAQIARDQAQVCEAEIRAGDYRGMLHGVPLGVKDLYDIAGLPTGCGSAVRAGHVATQTSAVVARLRAAGMVVIGKTRTHEFALGGLTPGCRNPWDVSRSPGGSSGGSAAAVASGQCLIATATDTAGSARVPAAACGVVGLKPTYGLVSRFGTTPLSWSLDTAGVLSRSVGGAAAALDALVGYDARDPASLQTAASDAVSQLDRGVRGLRLGVLRGGADGRIEPGIQDALDVAVEFFGAHGVHVQEVSFPFLGESRAIQRTITLSEASCYHRRDLENSPQLYTEDVRRELEAGQFVPATDYIQAQRVRSVVRSAWAEIFETVDAVVCPTMPIVAPKAGQQSCDWGADGAESMGDALFRLTSSANVTGLPALALPAGLVGALPASVQLTGPPLSETTLLRLGRSYELESGAVGHLAPWSSDGDR